MEHENQGEEKSATPGRTTEPGSDLALDSVTTPEPPGLPASEKRAIARALVVWLACLVLFGAGGVFFGQQEMAALVAFAGLYVISHAADADPEWNLLYHFVGWTVPLAGAVGFVTMAISIWRGDDSLPLRAGMAVFSFGAAAFSLATLLPPVARSLVATMFRTSADSHTLRLTARAVALVLLMLIPGSVFFPPLIQALADQPGGLIQPQALDGELVGYIVLALAGIGYLVRRDLKGAIARLGLRMPSVRDIGLVAAGAGALFAFNGAADWLQQHAFATAWAHDRSINQELVRGITTRQALLLGTTAGIGEEITLRGALQPRLGIALTAAVFASLHVQYSWYGMLVIFVVGIMLGLLRARAGTTVAIGVHALYDLLAIFTT
jgi:Type II CAAX prenyl endopeptidase Rce1-like